MVAIKAKALDEDVDMYLDINNFVYYQNPKLNLDRLTYLQESTKMHILIYFALIVTQSYSCRDEEH